MHSIEKMRFSSALVLNLNFSISQSTPFFFNVRGIKESYFLVSTMSSAIDLIGKKASRPVKSK